MLKNSLPANVTINGEPILHIAVEHNAIEICQLLLESGANVLEKDQKEQYSALHRAVRFGHVKLVNFLLLHATNTNQLKQLLMARDANSATALHLVSLYPDENALEIMKLLLNTAISPMILLKKKDSDGDTPLAHTRYERKQARPESEKLILDKMIIELKKYSFNFSAAALEEKINSGIFETVAHTLQISRGNERSFSFKEMNFETLFSNSIKSDRARVVNQKRKEGMLMLLKSLNKDSTKGKKNDSLGAANDVEMVQAPALGK